ncbi:MAG: hypothetical protein AAGF09_03025, partial [Pseudomonadota bacterium]
APRTSDTDYIDDIPSTKVLKPNERHSDLGEDIHKIDHENVTHLETIIAKHPELSLLVEHDVLVNGTKRRLRFRISLIEAMTRSLAAYTTLESAAKGKDALSSDKRSLKAIIVMAVGLRHVLEKAIHDFNTKRAVLWANNQSSKKKRGRPKQNSTTTVANTADTLPAYMFQKVDGLCLDHLLPAPSKQKQVLNNMILSLTEEEFEARMLSGGGGRATLLSENLGVAVNGNDQARIQVDESQGVFGF